MKKIQKFGLAVAGVGSLVSANAMAAIDTTAVETALDGSVASAESVGAVIIAAVAGLVVISLIIGLVKKLSA